jgi:iron complex transport system substrate-binding protein
MALENSKQVKEFPERIVCLSYDIYEILCAIGSAGKIVGKPSGTDRPDTEPAAKIGGYGTPDIDAIMAAKPDMVIGYSEICAKTMAKLISLNINTLALHHSCLEEIYASIGLLGRLTGNTREATTLIEAMRREFREIASETGQLPRRPVIYFEEWNNPYVCGVEWVTEIIDIAGGKDCFAYKSHPKRYTERRVGTEEITKAAPEIILASWCGNPLDKDSFKQRPGWESVPAVKTGTIYEVPGEMILQPGPGLVGGARFIRDIIKKHIK